MGTISEKLTYLNETKQELKQAINNIGGEVTDETTFRQYANQLQNVYDNLPKTEYVEGTEITLSNTLKGKLDFEDGKVGFGQASQESTQGYNLLNYNSLRTPATNVGISVDENGIVSGGNADSRSWTYASCNWQMTLPAGTYRVSLWFIEQITSSNGYFNIYDSNGNTIITVGVAIRNVDSYTTTFTLSGETSIGIILKSFGSKYKIMLETGSTAHEWEKYTGGQASPNPSYPQEIKYVVGRNKADYSSTYTSGSLSNLGAFNLSLNNSIDIETSKEYYFSADIKRLTGTGTTTMNVIRSGNNSGQTCVAVDRPNMTSDYQRYVFKCTYTQAQTLTQVAFQVLTDNSTTIEVKNIMVATENTPYLPYNTIEEVVSGKNLADIVNGGIWDDSGTDRSIDNSIRTNYIEFDINNPVVPSWTYSAGDLRYTMYFLYDSNKTYISNGYYSKNTQITTTNSNIKYIRLKATGISGGSMTKDDIQFQVEYGNQATTYEPYITPTSYQLSLGDIELNAIGDYKDYIYKNEGKWYKHRVIGKIILDGITNAIASKSGSTYNNLFFTSAITNIQFPTNNDGIIPLCSNYFINTSVNNMFANDITGIAVHSTLKALAIGVTLESGINTKELMNTWLSTHNTTVYYPLLNATDIEITDETLINQLNAWYNAHSNNGTTIITSNGDLPMIIKVRGLKGE